MQIQVSTDKHIEGGERFSAHVSSVVTHALRHFSARITRVEVHITDQNADSGKDEKRCVMEARIEGQPPLAVTHDATTVDTSIDGAAGKLERALHHKLDRLKKNR